MTNLCEIKSVSFYRNANNFAVYIVTRNIETGKQFSGKIYLEELPTCLLDQYLFCSIGEPIGTQKITEKLKERIPQLWWIMSPWVRPIEDGMKCCIIHHKINYRIITRICPKKGKYNIPLKIHHFLQRIWIK